MGEIKLPDLDKKILLHLCEGETAKWIAGKTDKSRRYIEWRIDRLRKKFDCRSTAHMVRFVSKAGLL